MNSWNLFLTDYKCLYAKEYHGGLWALIKVYLRILISSNTQVLFLIRYLNSKIGKYCRRRLRHKYHIECTCKTIGSPLRIPHPFNIIISAHSIGSNVQISQNVTLGGNCGKSSIYVDKGRSIEHTMPIIEDNIQISSNSVIAGPIVIGHDTIIGANVTVTRNIEPHSMIYVPFMKSTKKWHVKYGYQGFYSE